MIGRPLVGGEPDFAEVAGGLAVRQLVCWWPGVWVRNDLRFGPSAEALAEQAMPARSPLVSDARVAVPGAYGVDVRGSGRRWLVGHLALVIAVDHAES